MAWRGGKPYQARVFTAMLEGRISDRRIAWAQVMFGKVVLRQFRPQDEPDEEMREYAEENQVGPTVVLQWNLNWMRRPVSLNLTALTEEELSALRQVLDLAFDLAEPVVRDRDKVAKHAQAAGDDSYSRVYRQVPILAIREGKIESYVESVLDRPSDVSEGGEHRPGAADGGADDGRGGGVFGAGDGLVDEESTSAGSEDDGPETD